MTSSSSSSSTAGVVPRGPVLVVALAFFVDMLAYSLVVPFLPLQLMTSRASSTATGILFGSYAVALLVGSWTMAAVSRRFPVRTVIIAGLLGLVVSTTAYLLASSYAALLIARTLQGLAASATWTAGPGLLAALTSTGPARAVRGRVLAVAHTGSALGTLLGPPLGGALHLRGASLPFIVLVALVVIAVVAAIAWLPRSPPTSSSSASSSTTTTTALLRHPAILGTGLVIAVGGAVLALLEPVLPPYLATRFHLDSGAIGLVFGAALISYAVVTMPIGALADRFGARRVGAVGLVGCALVLPLITMAEQVVAVVVVFAALGVVVCGALGPAMAAMASAVDIASGVDAVGNRVVDDHARVYALYNTAYAIGMVAGPVLGSALVDGVGHARALQLVAGMCVGAAALASVSHRRRRTTTAITASASAS
ncbi:MAG TPA: MFS transporter [Myxococcota bacterium]